MMCDFVLHLLGSGVNTNHVCMYQKTKRQRPGDAMSDYSPESEGDSSDQHGPPPRHKARLGSDEYSTDVNRDEPCTPAGIGLASSDVLTASTTTPMKIAHTKPSTDASGVAMDIEVEHAPVKSENSASPPPEASIVSRLDRQTHEDIGISDHEPVSAAQIRRLDENISAAVEHGSAQHIVSEGISYQSTEMRVEIPQTESPQRPSKLYATNASEAEGEDGVDKKELGSAETETTDDEDSSRDQDFITPKGGLEFRQLRSSTPKSLGLSPVSACARRAVWTTYDVHKVQYLFKMLQSV